MALAYSTKTSIKHQEILDDVRTPSVSALVSMDVQTLLESDENEDEISDE